MLYTYLVHHPFSRHHARVWVRILLTVYGISWTCRLVRLTVSKRHAQFREAGALGGVTMQIFDDNVVSFQYTLKNDQGEVIESSVSQEPLDYLHGHKNIIPGLERELTGKSVGDTFTATIEPENAYGNYDEELLQTLSRGDFQDVDELEIGMQFEVQDSSGSGLVTVTKIEGDEITIDGNHPLAGERLVFEIEVVDIREASAEELSHGHPHHPDGHHH